jgi:proline iminopeptidase
MSDHEAERFYPEPWQRFRAGIPQAQRDGNLVAAYYQLLNVPPEAAIRQRAADEWCTWKTPRTDAAAG